GSRVGQPGRALGAGGGRGAGCRRPHALDSAAPDGVPHRALEGYGMRDAGCVSVFDVETPALLLHLDVVERNLAHMAARARQLGAAQALAGSGLHVWLKVDCGYHRAGVDPASDYAVAVARELGREQGLSFDGILSHSGHAYRTTGKAEAAVVAESERSVMVGFAERLRRDGISVREVSVGSTPAIAAASDLTGVTEARPGNYVFYDRTMVLIGCCKPADMGVSVLATVVSHQPGASHFVVDAGA